MLKRIYIYRESNFLVQDFKVHEKFRKVLEPWDLRGFKFKAPKSHDLYVFLNFFTL